MIRYTLSLLLFIIIFSTTNAQQLNSRELDSLYYCVIKVRRPDLLKYIPQTFTSDLVHKKSATGLFNAVKVNLRFFNEERRSILQSILDRPITDTNFVSPDNYFRIHFNKSGYYVPTYDVQIFAEALDSVYNFEVNYFGYPPPPSDNGEGGDNRYDIYITNTGGDIYGYTVPENEISPGSQKYTAYTVINNDFTGFYTTGIDAARVTAAHEFAHAIHVGNYINRFFEGDEFFYELSATAMEHFVFATIKDYLQYLPAYFSNTQHSFGTNGTIVEFALGIWNIYLADEFGFGIIKREWELMPQMRALKAIETSILETGSSFRKEFGLFGKWLFFTNYRAISGKYFEDAEYYPIVNPLTTIIINTFPKTVNVNALPVTENFIKFINPENGDTLYTDISNSDVENGIENINSVYPSTFSLSNIPMNDFKKLTDNYYSKLIVGIPQLWNETDILNGMVIREDTTLNPITQLSLSYAYPDPFRYNYYSINVINIPVKAAVYSQVELNVYSTSMELIYNKNLQVTFGKNNEEVITWNLDELGKKLPSGVYIYITGSGEEKIIGKLVIYNQ